MHTAPDLSVRASCRHALPLALLLALLAIGCSPSSPTSRTPAARVVECAGDVAVNGNAVDCAKPSDTALVPGDVVTATGSESRATLRFADGTLVRLFGLAATDRRAKLVIASFQSSTGALLLQVAEGLVTLVSSPGGPPRTRTLEAEHSVTAAEGTEVAVRSSPGEDTVSLKEGRATVTGRETGKSVRLSDSQKTTVRKGQPPTAPGTYDWSAPGEAELFLGPHDTVEKHF